MRKYWMAFVNGYAESTCVERGTREAALKDLKECFLADVEDCGDEYTVQHYYDYYIQEFIEAKEVLYYGRCEHYVCKLGKRGDVEVKIA